MFEEDDVMLSGAQLASAFLLAKAFGHEWALAMDEIIQRHAAEAYLRRGYEWPIRYINELTRHFLGARVENGGIFFPTVVSDYQSRFNAEVSGLVVLHSESDEFGELTWAVLPDGAVELFLKRVASEEADMRIENEEIQGQSSKLKKQVRISDIDEDLKSLHCFGIAGLGLLGKGVQALIPKAETVLVPFQFQSN